MKSCLIIYAGGTRFRIFFYSAFFLLYFFFFSSRRRHTRLQGDWSSDVCSSDLILLPLVLLAIRRASFPLLTTAFTLLILFGHPETMLHVVAIGGAYAALLARRDRKSVV